MVLTHRWTGVNDWDGMGFSVGFNAFFPPLSNGIITGLPSVDDSVCFQDVVVFAWTYPWCLDIDISWPHLWETESLMQISEQPKCNATLENGQFDYSCVHSTLQSAGCLDLLEALVVPTGTFSQGMGMQCMCKDGHMLSTKYWTQ